MERAKKKVRIEFHYTNGVDSFADTLQRSSEESIKNGRTRGRSEQSVTFKAYSLISLGVGYVSEYSGWDVG